MVRSLVSACLVVACVAIASIFDPAFSQNLYGVISVGTNAGSLVRIDLSTGRATLIGQTGMDFPGGLACDSSTGTLLGLDVPEGGQVWSIDPVTGAGTRLSSSPAVSAPQCLAYRAADNSLYTVSTFFEVELHRLSPTTGADVGVVGPVAKDAVGGLTVRPADGVLFGTGFVGVTDFLFTISTTPGATALDSNIGPLGRGISSLDFHPTSGILYASDGDNLVTINTSTGAVTEIGPHGDLGFVAGIAFLSSSAPTGAPDVWIRDCADDTGNVPSYPTPCPQYYTSPDIWIDNNGDMIIDAPVVGVDNTLYAAVRNRGGAASGVDVAFYYRDNTTGLVFPDGATLIGTDTVNLTAGGGAVASVPWPNLPAPPSTGGHWCIGVVLNHTQDPPVTPAGPAWNDNNVGIANIWFVAGRAGEAVVLGFSAGTGGGSGFGLADWPRDFVLEVEDVLPEGWGWTLEGAEAGKPFTLKLGQERPVKLRVKVPENAGPHTGGFVDTRQVDVLTRTVVGGVHFDLYEDHHRPQAVRSVRASVVDGRPVLTWDAVLKEVKTNLRERVAYYEVLRDGAAVAKTIRDHDPRQPGIQWVDEKPAKGEVKYAIRAIDEAGNVSDASPTVKVTVAGGAELDTGGGLFTRLTWILLVIAVALLLLVLRR